MKTFSLALAVSAIALFTFAPINASFATNTKCQGSACNKEDMGTQLKKHFKKATAKKHSMHNQSTKKKASTSKQ